MAKRKKKATGMVVQQHFVEFVSPGTFFAETTVREIESWDVPKAVAMSREIVERYGAKPYAFTFITRGRSETDLDSKEIARSNRYHLGGVIETIDDVRKRADPKEQILLSNMEINGWDKIVVNTNSWKSVQPLLSDDVVLDYQPTPAGS